MIFSLDSSDLDSLLEIIHITEEVLLIIMDNSVCNLLTSVVSPLKW